MRANVPPAPPGRVGRGHGTGTGACAGFVLAPAPRGRAARWGAAVPGGRNSAPGEADHARDGVRLEHGAHGVLRHPKPVLRRAALPLEVGRGQRPVRPDALEHAVGHRGVIGEGCGMVAAPLAARVRTEPGDLARRNERQRLVGRLEDLTAFVEQVAPGGLVVGDARVEHEVVVPAGDRDRIELDRPHLAKDLEHGFGASSKRPGRREEVPVDEKPPRRLCCDPHLVDASGRARSSTTGRPLSGARPNRVNGHVEVTTCGHEKSPPLRASQALGDRPPPLDRASRIRKLSPSVTTTEAWWSRRSRSETAVVCSGRKRPHDSNGQWLATPSERRS